LSADRVTSQNRQCANLEGLEKMKYKVMNDLVPSEFFLSQNYPNPFCDKTKIKFCIPFKTNVKLSVYNSDRELMIKLVDEEKEAGTYAVEFYPASSIQQPASGNYIYRLEAGDFIETKEMLMIK
jgi:hypothetical protein